MGNRDPTRMKSRPALAKGSTLGQPLLSWSGETARDIDLCGLGEHGSIHWGRIRDGTLTSVNSTYGVQEPGYRAATIVRDGLVAGVTSLRIEWLTRFHALEVGRTRSRLGRRLLRRGADQRTGRRLQRRDDRPAADPGVAERVPPRRFRWRSAYASSSWRLELPCPTAGCMRVITPV